VIALSCPGTAITEHDTGGASADLNARRMAITSEGNLEGDGSDGDGESTWPPTRCG
jgi:hypothetical protein